MSVDNIRQHWQLICTPFNILNNPLMLLGVLQLPVPMLHIMTSHKKTLFSAKSNVGPGRLIEFGIGQA